MHVELTNNSHPQTSCQHLCEQQTVAVVDFPREKRNCKIYNKAQLITQYGQHYRDKNILYIVNNGLSTRTESIIGNKIAYIGNKKYTYLRILTAGIFLIFQTLLNSTAFGEVSQATYKRHEMFPAYVLQICIIYIDTS